MRSLDLVEEDVAVAGVPLRLLRPRDNEALIDEHAFEREEYLPYWAELWPSALALADAVAAARPPRMLELGCGLGLPALVAAARGTEVLATDWSPEAVDVLRDNARRNQIALDVRRWDWSAPAGDLGRWPLVVAADVLYERRNGPPLLQALSGLGGEAWIADPGRPPVDAFLELAAAAGWTHDTVTHGGPPQVTIHRLRQ